MQRIVTFLFALALLLSSSAASAKASATGQGHVVRDGVRTSCDVSDANAIPFSAPSAARPWGTVLVGCFDRNRAGAAPALIVEWDLARGRALREVVIPAPDPADQIRIARGKSGIWAVISLSLYEGVTDSVVVLLDARLSVRKRWVFPQTSSADISADGELGAVSFFGLNPKAPPNAGPRPVLQVVTFDEKGARQLGEKWIAQRELVVRSWYRPFAELRVRGSSVVVTVGHGDGLELVRLSRDLRRTLARHHRKSPIGGLWEAQSSWLAARRGGWVLGFGDALFELDASLRVVKRHTGVRRFSEYKPERAAIDEATGRVVTEDGWLAPRLGAPYVQAVRFSREVVSQTSKLEARADATTAVLWAFGRAVIVRNAPGLGVTAIEPSAGLSPAGKK